MESDDSTSNVGNRSGGVDFNAERDISIGGDVVGRDKITVIVYRPQEDSREHTSQSLPDVTSLQQRWDALRYGDARFLLKALALLGKDEWIPCSRVALLTGLSNEAGGEDRPAPLEMAVLYLRNLSLIEEGILSAATSSFPNRDGTTLGLPNYLGLNSGVQEFVWKQISKQDAEELRCKLEANLLQALDDSAPSAKQQQAALLLTALHWLSHAWIALYPDTLLKYLEVVARYIDSAAERQYLEKRLNVLLDDTLIKLNEIECAQLLVQRAVLRAELGRSAEAAADYERAARLANGRDARLSARIHLGRANLTKREAEMQLAKATTPDTRQIAESGLRAAVRLYVEADQFARRCDQDPILRVHILEQLAYTHALLTDWNAANQNCQMAQEWIDHIKDEAARGIHLARVQETWSQVHFEHGRYLSALNDTDACAAFRAAYDIVQEEIEGLAKAGLETYDYVLAHYNAGEILHESHCQNCREPDLPDPRAYVEKALEMARRHGFHDLASAAEDILQDM